MRTDQAVYGRAGPRKTLLLFALAPVAALSAPVYLTLWPLPGAAGHLAFLTVSELLIIELTLTGFAKVPFTCSYLPGPRDALRHPSSYAKLMAVTLLGWVAVAYRARGARAHIAIDRSLLSGNVTACQASS